MAKSFLTRKVSSKVAIGIIVVEVIIALVAFAIGIYQGTTIKAIKADTLGVVVTISPNIIKSTDTLPKQVTVSWKYVSPPALQPGVTLTCWDNGTMPGVTGWNNANIAWNLSATGDLIGNDINATITATTATATYSTLTKRGFIIACRTSDKPEGTVSSSNVGYVTIEQPFVVTLPTTTPANTLQIGSSSPYNFTFQYGDSTVTSYSVSLIGGASPVSLGTVNSTSTNNPLTYGTAGTFSWTIPTSVKPGNNYKIQFTDNNGKIAGTSPAFNIIIKPVITINQPSSTTTWYNGETHNITWTYTGTISAMTGMNLYNSSGAYVMGITASHNIAAKSWSWTIPNSTTLPAGSYFIRIFGDGWMFGQSANFNIATLPVCTPNWTCGWGPCINNGQQEIAIDINNCGTTQGQITCPNMQQKCTPSITIISPNGGENWTQRTAHNITWTANGVSNITIYLVSDNSSEPWHQIAHIPASSGTYPWTISDSAYSVGNYKIYITAGDGNTADFSDGHFAILAPVPSITVTSPNGPEIFTQGAPIPVTWTMNTISQNLKIYLFSHAGDVLYSSSTPFSGNVGTNSWSIPTVNIPVGDRGFSGSPNIPPGNYKVRVYDPAVVGFGDSGDNYFTIVAP